MLVRRSSPKPTLSIYQTKATSTEDREHLRLYLGILLADPLIRIRRGEKERPKVTQNFLKLATTAVGRFPEPPAWST